MLRRLVGVTLCLESGFDFGYALRWVSLQLVLPKTNQLPTRFSEITRDFPVTLLVRLDFDRPKTSIGRRDVPTLPAAVPKTSIHKNR